MSASAGTTDVVVSAAVDDREDRDGGGRTSRGAARRRARQAEIVASTRALFDDRGERSANIDDIAKAVGVNRAIIYRHFSSKEELFALTLADYLVELDEALSRVDDASLPPVERLSAVAREFAGYCLRYPAFVDCALALLGRPGADLLDEISEAALVRLGTLMSGELSRIAAIVAEGESSSSGAAEPLDADLVANALYMQVLGVMHMARSGVVLRPAQTGLAAFAVVEERQIVELVVRMAVSVVFPGAVAAARP